MMGPGQMPPLSGSETYNEIVECLVSQAYKGQHMRCPAQTSASFGAGLMSRPRPEDSESKKLRRPQCYSIMWDVKGEFTGSYSALKEQQDYAAISEFSTQPQPVNPNIHGMKWIKEQHHSYRDMQLEFCVLL